MNIEVLNKALETIQIAFSLVELPYRLKENLGLNGLIKLFERPAIFQSSKHKQIIKIPEKKLSQQEAENYYVNLLNGLLCPFWVAIDEAFDDAFGDKNPQGNSLVDDFRAVIYMFRCAFSHKISQPIWDIKSKYLRSYHLPISSELREGQIKDFIFDFTKLNGQPVKTEDYNYFPGLLVLFKMACSIIERQYLM